MALLKMLADMMLYILRAPYALMSYANQFFVQRMMTERALSSVQREAGELSRLGKFMRFMVRALLWILLFAILAAMLVGLWYLNDYLNLERVLGGPWPALRPYWLPLLLVLFCVSCYVGYQLFRSLGPDRDIVEFADLEEAWLEARAALVEAGIDLSAVPLFLVLGRPASSYPALMSASRLTLAVQQIPLKANPPLQVYANKQAVYVVAPDASLLGRQAQLLLESAEPVELPQTRPIVPSVFEDPGDQAETTIPETATVSAVQVDPFLTTGNLLAELAPGAAVGVPTSQPAEPEKMPWMTEDRPHMPALLKRTEETEKYRRRLRYLARRISRDRAPYCPLNGVMLLVPFAALENDEDASQLAAICEGDLQVLHESARTSCPVIILVTDLETAPGYPALRASLDADRRMRLFGQELPLVPDLNSEDLPRMLSGSLRHFTHALAQWVLRLFRVEKSSQESPTSCNAANGQLFELLGAIRRREPALERLLTRIMAANPPLEFMLGGFYFAATGANVEQDQAFAPGVFQQLMQNQNAVIWTKEALAEEADYRRWTTYGYAALAIFCITVTVIIYGRWQMLHG